MANYFTVGQTVWAYNRDRSHRSTYGPVKDRYMSHVWDKAIVVRSNPADVTIAFGDSCASDDPCNWERRKREQLRPRDVEKGGNDRPSGYYKDLHRLETKDVVLLLQMLKLDRSGSDESILQEHGEGGLKLIQRLRKAVKL